MLLCIKLLMDVLDGLEVCESREWFILRQLGILLVRALCWGVTVVRWHAICAWVTTNIVHHRVFSAKRPSHLLGLRVFFTQLSILDQKLFNHLCLKLNIEIHWALGTMRAHYVQAWTHLMRWASRDTGPIGVKGSHIGTFLHQSLIFDIFKP